MKIAINGEILEVSGGGGLPEGTVAVKPLTQAEYDALTDEEKQADVVYAITDDGGSGDSGNSSEEIYSTEETRIGTWIDGKPLYRKVVSFTEPDIVSVPSSGPYTRTVFSYSEQIRIVRFSGTYKQKDKPRVYSLPWYSMSYTGAVADPPNRYVWFYSNENSSTGNTNLYVQGMANSVTNTELLFAGATFELILEYTKTTDTGGTT